MGIEHEGIGREREGGRRGTLSPWSGLSPSHKLSSVDVCLASQ
jgi:hypothetical protein